MNTFTEREKEWIKKSIHMPIHDEQVINEILAKLDAQQPTIEDILRQPLGHIITAASNIDNTLGTVFHAVVTTNTGKQEKWRVDVKNEDAPQPQPALTVEMWGLVYESIIQALRYYNAHHLTICASDELVEAIRKSSICNRVLDIIGPDGKNMLPLSCEERKELEALRAENVQIKQALRATNAWFYAEEHHESTTFHERMELCNYSEHLIENAAEEYCGVPHMVILPGLDVELVRADWQDAQEIVDRVLKEKEQPNDHE